jgi:WD40 repeat protein
MTDRDLFIAALEHADPAARGDWLNEACPDPETRRRVEILLKAHDQASQFLAAPAGGQLAADAQTRTGHPADETTPATEIDVRTFLAPSDVPGHLGRLDHFEILEIVGRGGMGVVLKALDPKLHRLVAVKLMAPHLAASSAARRRFEREAKAVAAVKNEYVVAIHDVQPDAAAPYLVMEFIAGPSLQDRLERSGPRSVKEVLRIGMQAASGLAAAHKQGLVHRDVKPANILLENGVERVKLTDFGLARAADDANLTQSGVITGTPNYMSPEQANGSAVDARSDLFSLGSVLYALCAGHPPFRADKAMAVLRRVCDDAPRPLPEVNADIPQWLDAIVRKLLAKDPKDRFQTATEVADLLGQHLAHLQNPAAAPLPSAVVIPLLHRAEPVWTEIYEGSDRMQRTIRLAMIVSIGLMLTGSAMVLAAGGTVSILFIPGLLFAVVTVVTQQKNWTVKYKGREVRFRPSVAKGLKLFVDDVEIASAPFDRRAELRGTIPAGPGAGDEVRAEVETGFARVSCRLFVNGAVEPTASPAAVKPGAPFKNPEAPLAGCLLMVGLLTAIILGLVYRDSLWEQLYHRGYYAPVLLVFELGMLGLITWLIGKYPDPRPNRVANRIAFVCFLAGIVGGAVVWGNNLGDPRKALDALQWSVVGLSLAAITTNLPAGLFRRGLPDNPEQARRDVRTARIVVASFTIIAAVCLAQLLFPSADRYADRLDVAWNQAFVDDMTVERDGQPVALPEEYSPGRGYTVPPGRYEVTGRKDGRVVYREAVTVEPVGKKRHVLWAFEDSYPEGVPTLAVEAAAGLTFTLTGPDHWCTWASGAGEPSGPGGTRAEGAPPPDAGRLTVRQGLRPDQAYLFEVHRGDVLVHTEGIRLAAGEHRVLPIGRIGSTGRAVELKPETGSFPTDVIGMTFSPDRSLVAVARLDGPILVFDAATGRERFAVRRLKSDCSAFGFTPDGKHLVYVARPAQGPQAVRFVSAADGTPGTRLATGPERGIMHSRALAFSPDGKRLAVATALDYGGRFMSRILRWEAETPGGLFKELGPIEWQVDAISALRFSPDGQKLRAVSGNAGPTRYEWTTGHADQSGGGIAAFDGLAAGPIADVATGWSDFGKRAEAYPWYHGRPDSTITSFPTSPIPFSAAAVSPDGSRVALGTKGGGAVPWESRSVVHVHDARAKQEIVLLLGPTDWVMDVAFGPDGKEVTAASKDGTVWTWRMPE